MSDDRLRDLAQIGSVGFTLVAYVLVFTGIGYGLDRLLGSGPWLMVGGVFAGAALGFYAMIKVLTAPTATRKREGDSKGPK
jgi:F0F1-type ATP synthase assembly protein I